MDPEVIQEVEAVLFASGRFVDARRIAELSERNVKHVKSALSTLQSNYAANGSALQVVEEDGAWKIHVRDGFLDLVSKVVSDTEVSGPVLETLAIIAWRSPALQSEVVSVRGSNTYEHVKELVEMDFVVKESEGRSYRLRITEKFFEYFDIEGRNDIRKVFKEVEEAHRKKEMDVELEAKRLAKAIAEAEQGNVPVVDIIEDTPASTRSVSIDDMDAILEKSRKTREKVSGDIAEAKKSHAHVDEEPEKELDEELKHAQEVRSQVEKDINEISK